MNLRCMYCQTMFGLGRENMLIALQAMDAENLSHFDFHCPKCRRANRVERKKLELANPNWQETLKAMAKEAAKSEKEQSAVVVAKAAPKPKAVAIKEKKAPAKAKVAPKAAAKKPAPKPAAKPAAKPKATTAKKPATTKTSAKKTTATSSPKGKAKGK